MKKQLLIVLMACGLMFATSCKEQVSAPVVKDPAAEFTVDKTSGKTPLSVKFTNTSTDATKYSWDFGDGSSSTEKEPSYTFTNTSTTSGRTYTVTLTAKNDAGKSSTMSKSINVDAATATPTTEDLLTAGPWIQTGISTFDGITREDVFFSQPPCLQDDIYAFKKANTYTQEEGKTRCNAADPTVKFNGTWSLTTASPQELILDDVPTEFIEPMTATSLKIKIKRFNPTVEVTLTFKR
jgi:PKD repeat protein